MNDANRLHVPSPRCCGCISVRTGAIILGIAELLMVGLSVTSRAYYLINYNSTVTLLKTGQVFVEPVLEDVSYDWYVGFGQLGLNGVQIFVIFLMLMGVGGVMPSLLLPHIVVQVSAGLALVGQSVLVCLTFGVRPYTLGHGIIHLLMSILTFYFSYAVYTCYEYLKVIRLVGGASNGYAVRDQEPNTEMTNL